MQSPSDIHAPYILLLTFKNILSLPRPLSTAPEEKGGRKNGNSRRGIIIHRGIPSFSLPIILPSLPLDFLHLLPRYATKSNPPKPSTSPLSPR